MYTQSIQELYQKVERLMTYCERLQQSNADLLTREQQWQHEKIRLVEKNKQACTRVEAIITQLKTLQKSTNQVV